MRQRASLGSRDRLTWLSEVIQEATSEGIKQRSNTQARKQLTVFQGQRHRQGPGPKVVKTLPLTMYLFLNIIIFHVMLYVLC